MSEMLMPIAEYGLVFVFVNVLMEQLGVPVPSMPTLIAAGVLAAQGHVSLPAAFAVALGACMAANVVWFVTGRRYGRSIVGRLCRLTIKARGCADQTEALYRRWGGASLMIAKFIPIASTIVPLLAGASGLRSRSFVAFNGLGAVAYAGVGIGAGVLIANGILARFA